MHTLNKADVSLTSLYAGRTSDGQLPATRNWLEDNWRMFVVGPDDLKESPEHSGIYFLWAPDSSLIYVGQSVSPAHRVSMHKRYGTQHTLATYLDVPPPLLDCIEYAYIYALKPERNTKYANVQWGGMMAMQAAIWDAWLPALR